MKSGPTLKGATSWPLFRSAAMRPEGDRRFPAPEWVPATTMRGTSTLLAKSASLTLTRPTRRCIEQIAHRGRPSLIASHPVGASTLNVDCSWIQACVSSVIRG